MVDVLLRNKLFAKISTAIMVNVSSQKMVMPVVSVTRDILALIVMKYKTVMMEFKMVTKKESIVENLLALTYVHLVLMEFKMVMKKGLIAEELVDVRYVILTLYTMIFQTIVQTQRSYMTMKMVKPMLMISRKVCMTLLWVQKQSPKAIQIHTNGALGQNGVRVQKVVAQEE